MQDRITAAVALGPPATAEGMSVYHELDPTFYSASSRRSSAASTSCSGWRTSPTAPRAPQAGYPQLSAEYVVGAAPDLIVLADTVCCDQTAEALAQRPAFDTVPAVQEDRVLAARRRRRLPLGPAGRRLRRVRRRRDQRLTTTRSWQ